MRTPNIFFACFLSLKRMFFDNIKIMTLLLDVKFQVRLGLEFSII